MTSLTCRSADAGSAADVINGDVPLDAVASVGTQDNLHVPCPVQTPRNRHLGLFPTVSLVTVQQPDSHQGAARSDALFEKNSRVTFQFSSFECDMVCKRSEKPLNYRALHPVSQNFSPVLPLKHFQLSVCVCVCVCVCVLSLIHI